MTRLVLLPLLALLLVPLAHAQADAGASGPGPALVERSMLDGRITLLVPEAFERMSEEMLALKYPSPNPPTEVLTNEEGSVNLAFNFSQNEVAPEQVAGLAPVLKQQVSAVHPNARWNRNEVEVRDGRDFVVLDLWTPALDTGIHNLMVATSVDGRLLLATFNVTDELAETWKSVGERMMASIRVVDQEQ